MNFFLEKNNLKKTFFRVLFMLSSIVTLHASDWEDSKYGKGVFNGIERRVIEDYWNHNDSRISDSITIPVLKENDYNQIIKNIKKLGTVTIENIQELRKLLAIVYIDKESYDLDQVINLLNKQLDDKLDEGLKNKNKKVIDLVFGQPIIGTNYSFLAYVFELYYLKNIRENKNFSKSKYEKWEPDWRTDEDDSFNNMWKHLLIRSKDKKFTIDIGSRDFALCCRFGNILLVKQFHQYGNKLYENQEKYWLDEMVEHKSKKGTSYFTTFFYEYYTIVIGGLGNKNKGGLGIENDSIEKYLIEQAKKSEQTSTINILQKNNLNGVKEVACTALPARFQRGRNSSSLREISWNVWKTYTSQCLLGYYERDCKEVLNALNKNQQKYTLESIKKIDLLKADKEDQKLKAQYIADLRKKPVLSYLNAHLPESEIKVNEYNLIRAILTSKKPFVVYENVGLLSENTAKTLYRDYIKPIFDTFEGVIVTQRDIEYVDKNLNKSKGYFELRSLLQKQLNIDEAIKNVLEPEKYTDKPMLSQTEQAKYEQKSNINIHDNKLKKLENKNNKLETNIDLLDPHSKVNQNLTKRNEKLKSAQKSKPKDEKKGKQKDQSAEQVKKLEKENLELKGKIQIKDNEIKDLNEQLSKKDSTTIDLKSKNDEINKLKNSLNDKASELGKLQNNLTKKENQVNELKKSLSNKESELDKLKKDLTNKENDIKKLKKSLSNEASKLSKLQNSLTDQVDKLSQDLLEKDKKMEDEKKKKEERINKIMAQKKNAEEKLKLLSSKSHVGEDKKKLLEEIDLRSKLQNDIKKLKKDLINRKNELNEVRQSLTNQAKKIKDEMQQKDKEIKKLKNDLTSKENEIKKLKNHLTSKENELDEVKQNSTNQAKATEDEMQQKDKKVNDLSKVNDQLQSKNNKLDKKVKKMESELNVLKNQPPPQEGNQGDYSAKIDRIKLENKQLKNTFFKLKIYSIVSSIIIFAMGSFAFFEYLKRKKNGSTPSTIDG